MSDTEVDAVQMIRVLLQNKIAYIGRMNLMEFLGKDETSMSEWEEKHSGAFPIECYLVALGTITTLIYPVVSVLEYLTGTERTRRILKEEGYITNG